MNKYVWIYPRNQLANLERCSIFYGTEVQYRQWLIEGYCTQRAPAKEADRVIKYSTRFTKEI